MAVLIASNLRKEFAADVLFERVSFTVGRKERLSLAGPNGAGKTTLLRGIVGETPLQGELAFAKSTRVALHDQRPPRDLGLTLREYAFGGARDLVALEEELRRLETAMAGGAHDEARLRPSAVSASPITTSIAISTPSQAASSRAPPSPARSPPIPTSCSSTSRRTTWTSTISSGSSASSRRSMRL